MQKLNLILLLCLLFSLNLKSQILNGDFEEYSSCPTGFSTPFDNQLNHCENWYFPTDGTSDYFNTCAMPCSLPMDCWGIPANYFGYQWPFEGNAYAGVGTYDVDVWAREFLGTELSTELIN